jgi:hypothetical protein
LPLVRPDGNDIFDVQQPVAEQAGELTGSFAAFSALASLRHIPRVPGFINTCGQFSNSVLKNDSKFIRKGKLFKED